MLARTRRLASVSIRSHANRNHFLTDHISVVWAAFVIVVAVVLVVRLSQRGRTRLFAISEL